MTKKLSNTSKPVWHGTILVAGGAIGAGMFALPMASAGAWITWSFVGFVLVWLMTYLSALLFASVNSALVLSKQNILNKNTSFSSIVFTVLGKKWAALNNLSIVFIMMILMYAYITAGGNILHYALSSTSWFSALPTANWLSLLFAVVIAFIVWLDTSIVSKVTLLLMIAMALSFGIASLGIIPNIEITNLTNTENSLIYMFAAMPVYVTAFACGGLVPSLVRHYNNNLSKVTTSLLWGTVIALLVYLFWVVITLGSIGRAGFSNIIANGSGIDDLVQALVETGASNSLQARLNVFSHCAIITSFLSIGLGLFHFMQDKLSLGKTKSHRSIAVAICFLPPSVGSFFLPYGFVSAIGYAGLFVAFSFFVLPGVMAIVAKKQALQISTNKLIPIIVIFFGVLIIGLKCALMFNLFPRFT